MTIEYASGVRASGVIKNVPGSSIEVEGQLSTWAQTDKYESNEKITILYDVT